MATEVDAAPPDMPADEEPGDEPGEEPATRERQVSSYDDLNGLTFGALKRLASDNGVKLAKFPKKHDIIKQILIRAESDDEVAANVVAAVPQAAHVTSPPTPQKTPSTKRVEMNATEERKERTASQQARAAARARAATTAVVSASRRGPSGKKDKPLPARPPLRNVKTADDGSKPHHRPRASSLPTKATLDTAELFAMNFTQLKHHAVDLGLELPRVPTKQKLLKMILAYQPNDFDDPDPDSGSEENVGDEKDEAPEDSPPATIPDAAPAAVVNEEHKTSDLMAMWRKKSNDGNDPTLASNSPSASPSSSPAPGKKSNLMSMWQDRADADKTPPAKEVTSGPPKRGGGKVSKFADMFANQNIPMGGSRPPRAKSPSRVKSPSPTPSMSPTPKVTPLPALPAAATEEVKQAEPEPEPQTQPEPEPAQETATDPPAPAPAEPATEATEAKTEEKKEDENSGPPHKTREELEGMGFRALKDYIKKDLGLPLPKVPNKANCIKAILSHQSGGESDTESRRTIKLKPKPKPKDVSSEIGGTSIADRLKMIAASQANHGVPPGGAMGGPPKKKTGNVADRFNNSQNATESSAPVDTRPKPKRKKIGKVGKIGGMGMAINIAALRPGFRPKPRARSSSMVTTQNEFENLELLRPVIQSGRRKSRMKGPGREGVAARILVEDEMD